MVEDILHDVALAANQLEHDLDDHVFDNAVHDPNLVRFLDSLESSSISGHLHHVLQLLSGNALLKKYTFYSFKANGANIEAVIRIEDEENNKPEDENTTVKKGESSIFIMLFRWTKMVLQTNYRPQRSWGKVIFSQASVILLTGGRAWQGVGEWGHAWLGGGVCGEGGVCGKGGCTW